MSVSAVSNTDFARVLRFSPVLRTALCLFATTPLFGAPALAQSYTLNTLASLNSASGTFPQAGVTLDSSGNLYGTTVYGGSDNVGTVYEIASGSNSVMTLVNFGVATGANPSGNLAIDASGNLYGTTEYTSTGGTGDGTVFKLTSGTDTLTTLVTFSGSNGEEPISGITLDSAGDLYGTTTRSVGGYGTVFKVAAGATSATTIASFSYSQGSEPNGVIQDSNGNLYGATPLGGPDNDGTVFEVASGGSYAATLAYFNGTNGSESIGGLTMDKSGNLYGTTYSGGSASDGTVFEIAAGSGAITTLATFTGAGNGANPQAGLILDSSGNLYGTTANGGGSGDGTVFKIAAGTDALTTLATLSSVTGDNPEARLTMDSHGDLYGTTAAGGASGGGTVFELSPAGAAAAPEPGALSLIPLGLPALAALARRRRRAERRA